MIPVLVRVMVKLYSGSVERMNGDNPSGGSPVSVLI